MHLTIKPRRCLAWSPQIRDPAWQEHLNQSSQFGQELWIPRLSIWETVSNKQHLTQQLGRICISDCSFHSAIYCAEPYCIPLMNYSTAFDTLLIICNHYCLSFVGQRRLMLFYMITQRLRSQSFLSFGLLADEQSHRVAVEVESTVHMSPLSSFQMAESFRD